MKLILFFFFLSSFPLFASFPIVCEGRTEITYLPSQLSDSPKKILSYSPINMDWEKKELRCDVDPALSKHPIQVVDGTKHLFANHLFVQFEPKGNRLQIKNLSLFGDVKLIEQEQTEDHQTLHTQYVLADHLRYVPFTDELLISSDPENQVYYYDDLNEYEMNASELILRRNPLTQKMKIQAEGPVHFSFKDDDLIHVKEQMTRQKKEGK